MQKQKPPQRYIRCTRRNGILAWHFSRGLLLRDGRPLPEPGELLKERAAKLCWYGLHASTKILDAYGYVSTTTVSRVRVGGRIDEHVSLRDHLKGKWVRSKDKICGTERVILWTMDIADVLPKFEHHLLVMVVRAKWPRPPKVVKEWMKTGQHRAEVLKLARGLPGNTYSEGIRRGAIIRALLWSFSYAHSLKDTLAMVMEECLRFMPVKGAAKRHAKLRSKLNKLLTAMVLQKAKECRKRLRARR